MSIALDVEGMHCEGCAARVKRVVEAKVPGTSAQVDLAAGRVVVEGAASADQVVSIITDAGYPAKIAA